MDAEALSSNFGSIIGRESVGKLLDLFVILLLCM